MKRAVATLALLLSSAAFAADDFASVGVVSFQRGGAPYFFMETPLGGVWRVQRDVNNPRNPHETSQLNN